jgi:hypothetical protein
VGWFEMGIGEMRLGMRRALRKLIRLRVLKRRRREKVNGAYIEKNKVNRL